MRWTASPRLLSLACSWQVRRQRPVAQWRPNPAREFSVTCLYTSTRFHVTQRGSRVTPWDSVRLYTRTAHGMFCSSTAMDVINWWLLAVCFVISALSVLTVFVVCATDNNTNVGKTYTLKPLIYSAFDTTTRYPGPSHWLTISISVCIVQCLGKLWRRVRFFLYRKSHFFFKTSDTFTLLHIYI